MIRCRPATICYDNDPGPHWPDACLANYDANPNNDVLIYAEGNVRVHGIVSPK